MKELMISVSIHYIIEGPSQWSTHFKLYYKEVKGKNSHVNTYLPMKKKH
jgi:hypothetical protein